MPVLERKLIRWIAAKRIAFLLFFASVIGLLIRLPLFGVISGDMKDCLLPWFSEISANGALRGLKQQVGDYNVFYQWLIALLTYLPFEPMTLIKSLSIAFDYLLALCAGKFVYDLTDVTSGARRNNFAFAYALTLLLPTVFLNSAAWGQCDSIYATFCVLCLDLLLPNGKNSPPPKSFVGICLARPGPCHEASDDIHTSVPDLSVLPAGEF